MKHLARHQDDGAEKRKRNHASKRGRGRKTLLFRRWDGFYFFLVAQQLCLSAHWCFLSTTHQVLLADRVTHNDGRNRERKKHASTSLVGTWKKKRQAKMAVPSGQFKTCTLLLKVKNFSLKTHWVVFLLQSSPEVRYGIFSHSNYRDDPLLPTNLAQ